MAQNKNYSDLFSRTGNEYYKENFLVNQGMAWGGWTIKDRWKVKETQLRPNSDFDKLMQGYDSTSDQYINQLKSIYNDFGKNADEYKNNLLPVLEILQAI